MPESPVPILPEPRRLHSASGLGVELEPHGALRRIDGHGVCVNLFAGNRVEGGPANLWLRRHEADGVALLPLLGPRSPLTVAPAVAADRWDAHGDVPGLRLHLQLRLAAADSAWFWHLQIDNTGPQPQTVDAVMVQDLALAAYGAIRLNEYYVSHYIDLAPFEHSQHGWLVAARQNLAQEGRHPWALLGALGRADAFATDASQVQGRAGRDGAAPAGLVGGLPSRRLQHEHALAALQHAVRVIEPGARCTLSFFALLRADHPAASSPADLAACDAIAALPEARPAAAPPSPSPQSTARSGMRSLFSHAPLLAAQTLAEAEIDRLFAATRRHEEFDGDTLLSFFHGRHSHVVLAAKEARVARPHGHILRAGASLRPDESALTSTVWMAGVFHSMLTQGHVSINRLLSTVRSQFGLFRSHGQRVFVELGGRWQLLGLPSAFEIEPDACRWLYKHATGLFSVRSRTLPEPQAMAFEVEVLDGPPLALRISHHIALAGDDGLGGGPAIVSREGAGVCLAAPPGSAVAQRFPGGSFLIEPVPGSRFSRVGGDEMLFESGQSAGEAFVCIDATAAPSFALRIVGRLLAAGAAPATAQPQAPLHFEASAVSSARAGVEALAEVLPWFQHNALVHYLAPRGLEQFSGGGWGTRDVCQGPLEMLLAQGHVDAARDLLCRVFSAQNADGDWPQWFMFFEREQALRAGDAHGDIVFWPLLGLARYLLASDDATLLDQVLPFHGGPPAASVGCHVERALSLIAARRIPGTALAAYGHGDWNDSLQPADPALRERLCSTWTVTLHHQMASTLARALRHVGRGSAAPALEADAAAVQVDFRRWLVPDGVVTGYAWFDGDMSPPRCLLHPSDDRTGLHYSLLPMMHAVLEELLTPEQARHQLGLIEQHLSGPDGARLFDRPMAYRGGPERFFQRAESSAFFGREIGLMYMHAQVRHAEMRAHLGDAPGLFEALQQLHPVGLPVRLRSASRRQSNCYFSSSDAAFADRYEASRDYARVADGGVALDGGWRIYSSGPGIALAALIGRWLGLRVDGEHLLIDPVLAPALDGMRARLRVDGRDLQVVYRVGPVGHGPLHVLLDGQPLPFERGANRYRTGAAQVSRAEFRARADAQGGSELVVTLP